MPEDLAYVNGVRTGFGDFVTKEEEFIEDWRKLDAPAQADILKWAWELLTARLEEGDRKYHSSTLGFQGNPVRHAIEEAADIVVYLRIIEKYVEALELRNRRLEAENAAMRSLLNQWGIDCDLHQMQ